VADCRESTVLAEQVRAVIVQLARTVRVVDTLTPEEAGTLDQLDRGGPQTTAELARLRGVRHHAAAKVVEDLTNKGFVRCQENQGKRRFLVHLTPVGRSVLDRERLERSDRIAIAIEEAFTLEQRRELERAVDILAELARQLQGSA
jgi:DNA-binding MarR family transcriptional regulator